MTVDGVVLADDASLGLDLPVISDELMFARLSESQSYTLVILKRTPKLKRPEVDPIIWEHGRRQMAMQDAGLLAIVCPVRDESEQAGIAILTVTTDRATEIYREDPGVKAGILTFEVHPVGGFPGAMLPRTA